MPRLTFRSLRRDPLLAVTTVATLAAGVGVATALFVYLDGFLHPRLLVPGAARVVSVQIGTRDDPRQPLSHLELERLRAIPLLRDAIGTSPIGGAIATAGGSRYAWGHFVSGDFFRFLNARPALGRLLAADDDRPGSPPVVVLGNATWRTMFRGDPAIVGRGIRINGALLTVVGVTREGFTGLGYAASFFVPLMEAEAVAGVPRLHEPGERWLSVLARLPRGATVAGAARAVETLDRELDGVAPLPDGPRRSAILAATSFDPQSAGDPYFHAARALTAAALLFLLLAAANIAGLLLARATLREREWAMRRALGAAPARLLAALAADVAAPIALGTGLGLLLALAVARRLEQMLVTPPGGIGPGWTAPGEHVMVVDGRAIAFGVAVAAIASALALLGPALRVLRADRAGLSAGDPRGAARSRLRRALVVVELAITVVLLIGGWLLSRSLTAAARAPLGFATAGLSEVTIHVPRGGGAATAAAWQGILAAVRDIPAVDAAALTHVAPDTGFSRLGRFAAAERPHEPQQLHYDIVSPGYFETLGIPLLGGRALQPLDAERVDGVVVVSRALAQRVFGSIAVVGRHLRSLDPTMRGERGPDFEIVGVTADAAIGSPLEPRAPTVFFVYGQRHHSRLTLLVRSHAALGTLEPSLRAAVVRVAPQAAIIDLVGIDEQARRDLHPLRTNAEMAGGLATLSLLTALVGLVALQLFAVATRRHELAVRLALGARASELARLVVGDSLRLALTGCIVGVLAALGATRFLRSLLFGVASTDPATYVVVPAVVIAVMTVASWWPAHRAARVDPRISLTRS